LAGLISALTMPDICGKILYPNLKPSDRCINMKEITDESKIPTIRI
jgi:hypothetical protein